MPGPSTTGKPNTQDYNLGRGRLYFAPFLSTGKPGAYRDLGNSPQVNSSVDRETLEHLSSREGLRSVDKEVVISQQITLTFQLDELNHENLADFFSGEKSTHTNVAVAGFAEHAMVPATEVVALRWYDIVNASGARAYDIDAADLTVELAAVPLVLNTDYEVDTKWGRIFLLNTATVTTNIAEAMNVTLTAKAEAKAVYEVIGLTKSAINGTLKFISVNPANNDEETEFQFHQISLKAEGEFAMISEEFTNMPFSAKAERNSLAGRTLTIRNVAA